MKIDFKTKLFTAILWILFSVLLVLVVLWQIFSNNIDYPFYFNNVLFIIVFIFFTRYIFLIKQTFIENKVIVKLIIMPLGIFMALYSYMALNDFIEFYQDNGIYHSVQQFPLEKQYFLGNYIRNQYIFFGVAAIITSVIMPVRMLISVFRVYNWGHE